MTNIQAITLGIVQGLTEYLPVSSSAHLVLVPSFLQWQIGEHEAFVFDVLIQLGTLLGVLIYFYDKLKEMFLDFIKHLFSGFSFKNTNTKLSWLIIIATIPASVIGLSFKSIIKGYFSSTLATGYCLIITAILLYVAEKLYNKKNSEPNYLVALCMGIFQALALMPGISRSGSTIAAGMFCGLSRQKAAQFSFFMSIPVMLGASLVASKDLYDNSDLINNMLTPITIGFISSAITGYLVIKWFMEYISKKSLFVFSYYCLTLGLISVIYCYL